MSERSFQGLMTERTYRELLEFLRNPAGFPLNLENAQSLLRIFQELSVFAPMEENHVGIDGEKSSASDRNKCGG